MRPPCTPLAAGAACVLLLSAGCLRLKAGGPPNAFEPPRPVDPAAIVLPAGYRIEPVITGLDHPTSVTFDEEGTPYVTEAGYLSGEELVRPRLLRIHSNGTYGVLATGERSPWGGLVYHQGSFYIAEGDEREGAHLVRITRNGELTPFLSELPSQLARPASALLLSGANAPARLVAMLGKHAASHHFDLSRSEGFGHVGQAFVARFGDTEPQAPAALAVGHEQVGHKVVRVDLATGEVQDFALNLAQGGSGPASRLGTGGLERPISARFDPSGQALYVVDYGVVWVDQKGSRTYERTGVLWRITRVGASE